jgi:DNA primase
MAITDRPSIADLYEREILPALQRRLDEAFPEFGWQRDPRGWHASNQELTHTAWGVRADRVVCHGDAPRGFLIHGLGPVLWTTYINSGRPARGREFIDAVRTLAARADVAIPDVHRPYDPAQRKARLLHDAFVVSRRELASDRGDAARSYLVERGIPEDRLATTTLGVVPDRDRLYMALVAAGYTDTECRASGLFADTRWPGRVVGAWRDEDQRVVTLWARTTRLEDDARYLYLRGAPRGADLPYGFSDLLTTTPASERGDLILVEGVLDVHHLRAHGIDNVAALGGCSAPTQLFARLADHGIERVTLALDNDTAGIETTTRLLATATATTARITVVATDPTRYRGTNDPGELLHRTNAATAPAALAPARGTASLER